ncbi:MAG: pilus assembly protein [Pararhodobacter sp.]|nr:pilus assembly protein [Pararhodobacter sp.]
MPRSRWKGLCKRLQPGDDSGSVSVEFAIWLPLLVVLTVTIVDASSALMNQATMWRVAGDTARGVATGRVGRAEAEAQVARMGFETVAVTTADDMARVHISVPFSSVGTGSLLSPLGSLNVAVAQRLEPHVTTSE